MSAQEIEMILARHLASYLAMPIFLVGPQGDLVYYNEPAEAILGSRFEETGAMPAMEWATAFKPFDEQRQPIAPEQLPLMIALKQKRPAHSAFWISGMDRVQRHIEVMAIPLVGQADRFIGALAMFWEVQP